LLPSFLSICNAYACDDGDNNDASNVCDACDDDGDDDDGEAALLCKLQ